MYFYLSTLRSYECNNWYYVVKFFWWYYSFPPTSVFCRMYTRIHILKVVPQGAVDSLISVVWCEWVHCAIKIDSFVYQDVVKSNQFDIFQCGDAFKDIFYSAQHVPARIHKC